MATNKKRSLLRLFRIILMTCLLTYGLIVSTNYLIRLLLRPINDGAVIAGIQRGDTNCVRGFLDAGGNPNLQAGDETLLQMAKRLRKVDIVRMLIKAGATQ